MTMSGYPKRITRVRMRQIRELAKNILSRLGYSGGPVDVQLIARNLGAVITFAPYKDGDLAGMLVRRQGQVPIIAVNSAHHPNRRRFTIAHECGHLILHKRELYVDDKLSIQKRDRNSSLAISIEEIEANQFASELLMPYHSVLNDINSMRIDVEDDSEISLLSKKYKVSKQAMTYRIYNISDEEIFQ